MSGDRPPRPDALDVRSGGIPDLLTDREQWVCWRYEWDTDRDEWTKAPIKPYDQRNGTRENIDPSEDGHGEPEKRHPYAGSTWKHTWRSFEQALEYHESDANDTDGVGFIVHEGGTIAGLDADDCRDATTGERDEWADDVLEAVGTYAEVSPSGTGLRQFGLGFTPDDGTRADIEDANGHIEMYDSGRYLTVTGHHVDGTPEGVQQVHREIEDVHAEYIADDENAETSKVADNGAVEAGSGDANPTPNGVKTDLEDDELLDKAKSAENGDGFHQLWRGDTSGHESHSEADLALVNHLAFWTGGDRNQIDRLFRRSGLMRGKWDREDYRERTMDKALKGRTDFYDPGASGAAADTAKATDGGVVAASTNTTDDDPSVSDSASFEERVRVRVLEPLNRSEGGITSPTAIGRFAAELDSEWHFVHPGEHVKGWYNELYRYNPDTGVYERGAKEHVVDVAERTLGDFATNHRIREIVAKVERRNLKHDGFGGHPARLVVGNGVLDFRTLELTPHTPEEFHQQRIAWDYDADADAPEVDEFLHDVVGSDEDAETLYQLMAHALHGGYADEKLAMLVGDGENGKSVYLWLVRRFLSAVGDPVDVSGRDAETADKRNVSNVPLSQLTDDGSFAIHQLNGKMANINADLSGADVRDQSVLKKMTGDDPIWANVKNKTPIQFMNRATGLFATNTLPQFEEDTHAVWRRWMVVKFPYTFVSGEPTEPREKAGERRGVLKGRIGAESEMEGLLARAARELHDWYNNRERDFFTEADGAEQVRDTMLRGSNPVYHFARVALEEDGDGAIPKDDVRDAFRAFVKSEDISTDLTLKDNKFGEHLKALSDYNIATGRERIDGARPYVYKGVSLTSRGEQLLNGGGMGGDGTDAEGGIQSRTIDDATSNGGPAGRADTVRAVVDDLQPDGMGGVEVSTLAGVVGERHDISPRKVERAVDRLSNEGRIIPADGGGYRTNQ